MKVVPNPLPAATSVQRSATELRRTRSARRSLGLSSAPLVFAVGLLVASQPAHTQEKTAAPREIESRLLTLEQLHNGQYYLPLLGDEETPIRFHEGQGSIKYGAGATQQVQAGLVGDLVAFGDLDGDQVADAAAVVFIDPGGSGTFIHLLAIHGREGAPFQAGREFLGDRVRVDSITIRGGRIFVTMIAHGPGDGMCCPSTRIRRAFTLHGRRLVPTEVLAIESPLPGGVARRYEHAPVRRWPRLPGIRRARRSDRHGEDPRCGGVG